MNKIKEVNLMSDDTLCILGEPAFETLIQTGDQTKVFVPTGQIALYREVLLDANNNQDDILLALRKEYLAIVFALTQMNIDFRIVLSHINNIDRKVMNVYINELEGKTIGFPNNFPPSLSSYPRDLFTHFPNYVFFNSTIKKLGIREKDGYRLRLSPYGEGGRVLNHFKTMLVGDRLNIEGNVNSSKPRLNGFKQLGIKYGFFPSPLGVMINLKNVNDSHYFLNDHIDRVATLLFGKDGNLHLVVDSNLLTGEVIEKKKKIKNQLEVISSEKSLQKIAKLCNDMGIKLHCPKKLSILYALNLMQFPDGRVLMTSGDEEIYQIVAKIVGIENVFTTEVPIRYLPVYARSGIRCMINHMPNKLLKSISMTS